MTLGQGVVQAHGAQRSVVHPHRQRQPGRLAGEGLVKRHRGFLALAECQMQRIRKVHSVSIGVQGLVQSVGLTRLEVRQPQQQLQPARHIRSRAIIRFEYPYRFQEDSHGRREDLVCCQ
jgi:hypothetical protein